MRKAMSLIELVFAIVIMGISVMSLPMILTQTQETSNLSLRQETILSIKAKLAYILAYPWDENTYDATADTERVLNIPASGDTDGAFATATIRRVGHVNTDGRRRLWDNLRTPAGALGADSGDRDDIDDFSGAAENKVIAAGFEDDFIFNLTLTPTIRYLSDTPAGGSTYANNTVVFNFNTANVTNNLTNIKIVQVTGTTVLAGANIPPITMFAFSSNIGQSKILRRTWQ